MFELKKRFKLSCAHRLNNPEQSQNNNKKWFGKCNEVHGHNYYITLILRTTNDVLGQTGMITNFDNLKVIFKEYIDDIYDHKLLNDCPGFKDEVATAEHMAKLFFNILKAPINELYAVEVEETEGASATYYRSE